MPKSKKKPKSAMVVDRRAFLSALELTSAVLMAMSDEFEIVRNSPAMDVELKRSLLQVIGTHMRNLASVSHAFSSALPNAPGSRSKELN